MSKNYESHIRVGNCYFELFTEEPFEELIMNCILSIDCTAGNQTQLVFFKGKSELPQGTCNNPILKKI